ncbi:hypothetical protein [Chryseobacterium sp. CT-SW4]|uniref:hypothetical protein n=1 Tax=Chryseobacterium sp. SW-1 TaxID=3157343 RepID=UPI003B021396
MIPQYRERFNREFTPEKYEQLKESLSKKSGVEINFRISESPVFLSQQFKDQLLDTCREIFNQIKKLPQERLQKIIPEKYNVPNDTSHPHFFCIDFGICQNEAGDIEPQLIELQAFPSLFSFLKIYEETVCEVYPFLNELRNTHPSQDFMTELKELIIGDEQPENVILLEIHPEKQKTAIDFALTEQLLGIKTVCLTSIEKKGRKIYYNNDGKLTEIKRIYNRVILEELDPLSLSASFDLRDDVDVKWLTHPNWFFKISKYILPLLHHPLIPESYFLRDFPDHKNLKDFVLKPLFSLAGKGVNLNPTQEFIDSIQDKDNFILQKKVEYAPVFKDIHNEYSKGEIRLLYIWKEGDENPVLMENLVRMTKSEMINSEFNKDKIWTGSSYAFFEKK